MEDRDVEETGTLEDRCWGVGAATGRTVETESHPPEEVGEPEILRSSFGGTQRLGQRRRQQQRCQGLHRQGCFRQDLGGPPTSQPADEAAGVERAGTVPISRRWVFDENLHGEKDVLSRPQAADLSGAHPMGIYGPIKWDRNLLVVEGKNASLNKDLQR